MNILTINFGGIGDEILFLPTLISLKKEFPKANITLALEPRSKGIKDLTDIIDNLFLIDLKNKNKYFELLKLISLARNGHFDMVISSGGNKLISILLFLTGIKKRYGYDTGKLSRILLTKAIPLNKNQYACKMYHDLISPITNVKTELPEINIEPQEKIPNSILIHPGVSKMSVQKGMTKTVSADIWAETIELLINQGKHVILAGGPDDEEVIEEIEKYLEGKLEEQKSEGQEGILDDWRNRGIEDWSFNNSSLNKIPQKPQTDNDLFASLEFAPRPQSFADVPLAQSDQSVRYSPICLFTNLYGKTKNLKDLAILIGKAEKFLCSDSAPLHIAVAMKTKTYVIFGPTDDKKLIPHSDLVTPIKANDNCNLKPCLWGKRQTTCETLQCLKISANDVQKYFV